MAGTVPVETELPELIPFARRVHDLVGADLHEVALTVAIRDELELLLASGINLPADVTRPDPDRYVMYPLHVAADGSFSIASAVWDVGQGTPVHGHETWGVVGIYSGVELETQYEKPLTVDQPLRVTASHAWSAGQVSVCCTTDDDVHQVSCGGDQPVVGIHVYGGDIGILPRRSYDPATGAQRWFISEWAR